MPELPEVQTTVNGLSKTIIGFTIDTVWTDLAKNTVSRSDFRESIKYLPFFKKFAQSVEGKKVISVERRAKNILINLSGGITILVHMKMTGHILYGLYEYDTKKNTWEVSPKETNDALRDPFNRFIHFVITFKKGKQLVLCDSRKFAKVTLVATAEIHSSKHTKGLGPEIFDKAFNFEIFKTQLSKKPHGKIKSVLMDQTVLAGIGNIYSDEALWLASIHPKSTPKKLPEKNLKELFESVKTVLAKGIDFGGDSMSDYRRIDGTPGEFHHTHNAYRLTGTKCKKPHCGGMIQREMIGGRSAHFCDKHQKLFV